jgi:outer membrane biosynthesis protein TonB
MFQRRAYLLSALLHLAFIGLMFVHLPITPPSLSQPKLIPLQVITISDKTAGPLKPKTQQPKKEEKKEPPKAAPKPEAAPKEEPKPEPAPVPKPEPKLDPAPIKKPAKDKPVAKKETTPPKSTPKPKDDHKKKPKKKVEDDFLSVLKTVEDLEPEQKELDKNAKSSDQGFSSDNIEDILTISEMDALKQQLRRCWNPPTGAKEAENLIVELEINVNPDATVRDSRVSTTSQGRSNSYFPMAADSARRALNHPDCTPLKLPKNKYDEWKSCTITFNPKEMFK